MYEYEYHHLIEEYEWIYSLVEEFERTQPTRLKWNKKLRRSIKKVNKGLSKLKSKIKWNVDWS